MRLQEAALNPLTARWAQAFMSNLQLPLQTFPMEIFYMLYELKFETVSPEVIKLLRGFSRAWLHTLINEKGFNALRSSSTNSAAGVMSRTARWGTLAASDLV